VLLGKTKQRNEPFFIWGSGKPLRQFIYSKDLAELMMWYLLQSNKAEPVILATDPQDEISIADAAHLVVEAMDFKGKIVFDSIAAVHFSCIDRSLGWLHLF
jgi:GDP-L-fucose synthase